ncbi:MAG: flagellar basal-body MS-ring/collar protein FliF [Clostridia bacterium]|nr:flagellar basal-body MS-ring/collar protein FliF [Clostridia bacterium]
MPEVLTRLQQRVVDFWKNLDKSQKIRVYIIAGILVVAVAVGMFIATRTTYVPLFSSGLNDQKELSEITAILSEGNIKYKPDNNNILIDSRSKSKAEQLLVEKGYPKSIDAIFNESYVNNIKLSTTESDKRKFDKNTQERLLAAKLKMFDYIEDATVTLTIPEESVLLLDDEKAEEAKAAIWIKPRVKLNKDQVNAIVMWISKSVEKLDPKNITVVDNNMKQLTSDAGDDSIDKVNDQYEMTLKWATELERKVKKLFEGQFESFDDMAVVANPKLNFNKQKTQSKRFENPTADGPAVRSSETTKIELKNGSATGGAPGVGSNPGTGSSPSYQIETNGDNSSYKETREIVNNEFNETLTELESSVGDIVSDQSSIAVNVKYGIKAKDVTTEEIETIKQMVSRATSIPVANIAINKFKIAPPEEVQTQISDRIKDIFNTYGLFALIVILAIGLMIAALPKRKKKEEEPALEPALASAGGPRFIVPEHAGEPIPEIDIEERSEVKKQIEKFVKQKPEAVASLLRNWLSDEWDG